MSGPPLLTASIQSAITRELPLGFEIRMLPSSPDGECIEIIHGENSHGFVIRALIGWKSLELSFIPQDFAASLVQYVENLFVDGGDRVSEAFELLTGDNAEVHIEANGTKVSAPQFRLLPRHWRSLIISAEYRPVDVRKKEGIDEQLVASLTGRFAGCLRRLLPLEVIDDLQDEDDRLFGIPEGERVTVQVNRFERSRANRETCIRLHGATCKACGFDFEREYGPAGRGYIQIHHVVMIAKYGGERIVNPATDLVPLCANCHCMAHRREPPYSIQELREMLGKNSDS